MDNEVVPGPIVVGQIVWDSTNQQGFAMLIEDGQEPISSTTMSNIVELMEWLDTEMSARA